MSTRRAFWKVIAFLHDETGELTATGYSISPDEQMPAEEFVFSAYETYQRPLSWIGDKAGISFPQLAGHHPLRRGFAEPAHGSQPDQVPAVTGRVFAPLEG